MAGFPPELGMRCVPGMAKQDRQNISARNRKNWRNSACHSRVHARVSAPSRSSLPHAQSQSNQRIVCQPLSSCSGLRSERWRQGFGKDLESRVPCWCVIRRVFIDIS